MSTRIIGAYGKIRFEIDSDYYVLPVPNRNGLKETTQIIRVEHELEENNEIIYKEKAYRKRWEIDYSQWLRGEHILKLQSILSAQKQGKRIWFYPRQMDLSAVYDVYIENAELLLQIMRGNANAPGMKGLILNIVQRKAGQEIGWRDLATVLSFSPTITAEVYNEFSD